jgi:murein DD-endopeptidase MepM/ murein hydrolase activator NlpD
MFLLLTASQALHALPEQALVPGGIAILGVDNYQPGTDISFDGRKTTLFQANGRTYALAGIPLKTSPGEYSFSITPPGGPTLNTRVSVTGKTYEEQHLTIKNKRKVNPNQEDMDRISKERVRKRNAKLHWSEGMPDIDFIWPVQGEISSIFGLRRFFNGEERRPHTGLDIAAPEGTPVRAGADGTVIETGNFFFSGNMVYIDHGQGLISLYAHLSRIDVEPGQKIRRGDVLGAVGQTGRVTGAHLHFALMTNGVLIDPLYLLPTRQALANHQD